MTPASQQWHETSRTENAAALEAARNALPPLESKHEASVAALGAVTILLGDVKQDMDRLEAGPWYGREKSGPTHIAEPLALQFGWLQNEVAEAKSREAQARCAVEVAKRSIDELERAVRQADWLLALADEKAAA